MSLANFLSLHMTEGSAFLKIKRVQGECAVQPEVKDDDTRATATYRLVRFVLPEFGLVFSRVIFPLLPLFRRFIPFRSQLICRPISFVANGLDRTSIFLDI